MNRGLIDGSFLTDYFHTVIILAICCYFSVKGFQNDHVGSVGELFDLIQKAGQMHPVSGNSNGSYLTMTSKSVRPTLLYPTRVSILNKSGHPLRHPPHMLQLRPGHRKFLELT